MLTDKKGHFNWSHCQPSLLIASCHVESYSICAPSMKTGPDFLTNIGFFWRGGLVSSKCGSYSYSWAHSSAQFWVTRGRSCPLYIRCDSVRAVWITDGMSSLCLEETTFWHLGEEWRRAGGLQRDVSLANEDTVKTHAHTHADKQDGGQFVRADRPGDKKLSTHTHTKDLTVGMIAGSRQHFHTSLSSSFFLRWQGPMGESSEGQEREMLSVCMCVSMSLRCATIKEYHNILFVKVIIFILYPE